MRKIIYLVLSVVFLACNQQVNNEDTKSDSISKPEFNAINAEKADSESVQDKFILDKLMDIKSEIELKERYGAENITRRTESFAEGTITKTLSILYPETEKELTFMWKDDSVKFENLNRIILRKSNSPWKTKLGITIGIRMSELEKINTKPFSFSGFGWDYGGQVVFNDGIIGKANTALILGASTDDEFQSEAYKKLIGDSMFESNSEQAVKLNPSVVELSLYK
jgi:hypothetical protein